MITILSQIYDNTKPTSMILATVALVLFTAMLMSSALGYSYHMANASSSANCEGDECHTSICINNNCHTSVSNLTQQLNSMVQSKVHGLLSNSIQQLLNSTNP
jgi:hypothetical protein